MFKSLHFLTVCFALTTGIAYSQVGTAIDLDGVDDNIFTTNPAVFDNIAANSFTFELWLKPESNGQSRLITAQKADDELAYLAITSTNEVEMYVEHGALIVSEKTTATLTNDVWYHLAATWDGGADDIEIYIDAVAQPTVAGAGSAADGINALAFGSIPFSGPEYFDGELDDIRVWSDIRTPCEILVYMNSELYGGEIGLERYFKIDEGIADGDNSGINTLDDFASVSLTASLQNFDMGPGSSSNLTSTGSMAGTAPPEGQFYVQEYDTICYGGSYTFPDGSTQTDITLFTNYTSTISGAAAMGCDSTYKTTLTLIPTWNVMVDTFICPGSDYTFPDASVMTNITSDVTHESNFLTTKGCDSIITTNIYLIIPEYEVNVIGSNLTAYEPGASWQWLDCDDGMSPIAGATGPEYDPMSTGNYAVIVTVDGCPDTSDCVEVTEVTGLFETADFNVQVFPNPVKDKLSIVSESTSPLNIHLIDMEGRIVIDSVLTDGSNQLSVADLRAGVYMLRISSGEHTSLRRIIIQK